MLILALLDILHNIQHIALADGRYVEQVDDLIVIHVQTYVDKNKAPRIGAFLIYNFYTLTIFLYQKFQRYYEDILIRLYLQKIYHTRYPVRYLLRPDDGDLIQPDPGLSCPGGAQGSSCNCGGTHKEIGYTPGHYCTGR